MTTASPRRADFAEQVEDSLRDAPSLLSGGYQGSIHLLDIEGRRLVVKTPTGRGPGRWIRLAMLRNEYRVYQRLEGVPGIPECFGLVAGRHLVLEYVAADNLRSAEITDRNGFYRRLRETIERLHDRGVAHGDLKKKDNILVLDGDRPVVVDFGTAVIRRRGLHPINQLWFAIARTWDHNAWVKRKYGGYTSDIAEDDLLFLQRTWLEAFSRFVRRPFAWLFTLFR